MTLSTTGSSKEPAELYILGDIVEDVFSPTEVSPSTVVAFLQQAETDEIVVHLNSYGGITSAGIAIYNLLRDSGKEVTTVCEGFACSAASLIFMAGKRRVMRDNSLLMIHNAWTVAQGNAGQLRETADDLDTISAAAAKIYSDNSRLTPAELDALLEAEAWITPEMAVENGFATEIVRQDSKLPTGYSSAFGAVQRAVLGQTKKPVPAGEPVNQFDVIFGGFA